MNDNLITDHHTPAKSFVNTAYKWALITSAYLIIKTYAIYLSDPSTYHPQKGGMVLGLLDLLISLVAFYMANKEFRDKENGGFLTYGKGFVVSYVTGLFITAITTIFMFVFLSYQVDFDLMVSNMLDENARQFKARGMGEQDIAEALKRTKEFSTVGTMLTFSSIMFVFLYAIFALIVAAITKRNPPTAN